MEHSFRRRDHPTSQNIRIGSRRFVRRSLSHSLEAHAVGCQAQLFGPCSTQSQWPTSPSCHAGRNHHVTSQGPRRQPSYGTRFVSDATCCEQHGNANDFRVGCSSTAHFAEAKSSCRGPLSRGHNRGTRSSHEPNTESFCRHWIGSYADIGRL